MKSLMLLLAEKTKPGERRGQEPALASRRVRVSPIKRHRLAAAASLAAGCLILAGCGGSGNSQSSSSPASPSTSTPSTQSTSGHPSHKSGASGTTSTSTQSHGTTSTQSQGTTSTQSKTSTTPKGQAIGPSDLTRNLLGLIAMNQKMFTQVRVGCPPGRPTKYPVDCTFAATAAGEQIPHAAVVKDPKLAHLLEKAHPVTGKIIVFGVYAKTETYEYEVDFKPVTG